MVMEWLPGEERYLEKLRHVAREMYLEYKDLHIRSRTVHRRIRLPAIIISSIGGVCSFGTNTFPHAVQKWISVGVGAASILIAILNTIEGFLKLEERASGSLNATRGLEKLCDDIECETSLPVRDRQTTGAVFVRDCYTRFQQILDSAPTLDELRTLQHEIGTLDPDRATCTPRSTAIDPDCTDQGRSETPASMRLNSVFSRPKSIYQKSGDVLFHAFQRIRTVTHHHPHQPSPQPRPSAADSDVLVPPHPPAAPASHTWEPPSTAARARILRNMLGLSIDGGGGRPPLAAPYGSRKSFRPPPIEQIPEVSECGHELEHPAPVARMASPGPDSSSSDDDQPKKQESDVFFDVGTELQP